jgi:hypothetical protein
LTAWIRPAALLFILCWTSIDDASIIVNDGPDSSSSAAAAAAKPIADEKAEAVALCIESR